MGKLKTNFQLERTFAMQDKNWEPEVTIVDGETPYISFTIEDKSRAGTIDSIVAVCSLDKKQLRRFAENLLKILNQ